MDGHGASSASSGEPCTSAPDIEQGDLTVSVLCSYRVGDTVHVDVKIDNPTPTDKKGTLTAIFAIDDPRSQLFPDQQSELGVDSVSIASGSSETYAFTFTLPGDIRTNQAFSVEATAKYVSGHKDDFASAPLAIQALFDVTLTLPASLHTCPAGADCSFAATVRMTNRSSVTVTDLNITVYLPFGVQTTDGGKNPTWHEDQLPGKAALAKTLQLKVVSPSDAANFEVDVSSTNGGSVVDSQTMEIDGT